ncbi:hypothetical protein Dvina_30530 [Dactylosporangium vinaceum]|uniref:DNA mimic protein DMP19 C-terminal domain-containing protein n=1 Tax=Dactylosporangium vinaceum TaxID=53362 RepID=A0ABV5MKG6_9ACTN|nr:hypothetical protein [Dactylosporangium vinaceum]UAB92664.1 hypothetical protein Dvina_30530 [Dactylosporangium vinaceum]
MDFRHDDRGTLFSDMGEQVWNDSGDLYMRMYGEGEHVADAEPPAMRHLAYIRWFDDRVMASGLSEALRWHPAERMTRVATACDYFGLADLAELMRALAADHENYARAESLNVEYWNRRGRRPEDNAIEAAMEERLRTAPEDFGRGAGGR